MEVVFGGVLSQSNLAKSEKARWDKLSPEEQRKEQDAAYRQQAYCNT